MSEEHPKVNKLKGIQGFVLDAAREGFGGFVDGERQDAVDFQWQCDIRKATMAFAELGVDDYRILGLLNKYFEVNEITETKKNIKEITQIKYPFRRLVDHLVATGFTHNKAIDFMESNSVEEKLRRNPSLAKLPPEELKRRVEKASD